MTSQNGNSNQGGGSNSGNGDGNADKLIPIFVNGTAYEVAKGKISYERLLELIDALLIVVEK